MVFSTINQKQKLFLFIFCIAAVLISLNANSTPLSDEEIMKVWRTVCGNNKLIVTNKRLEAECTDASGTVWTIQGANLSNIDQLLENDVIMPREPLLLVVTEPLSNYKILPYTNGLDNVATTDEINISGSKDTTVPASFVIRSANEDINNIIVTAGDIFLTNSALKIPKENVDIRIVKVWYQAGVAIDDNKHKTLTPELLVHDDDIVRTDLINQVNLIRNQRKIADSSVLLPFSVGRKQNKQLWINIRIPISATSGNYTGQISVQSPNLKKTIKLNLKVLPQVLLPPTIEYAIFFEKMLVADDSEKVESRMFSERQYSIALEDLKDHGITNATVFHKINRNPEEIGLSFELLEASLRARQHIGWGDKPLFYLDWHPWYYVDRNSTINMIKRIVATSRKFGIKDVYIYGVDEKQGDELKKINNTLYRDIHDAGARVYVAGTAKDIATFGSNIDLAIIAGPFNKSNIDYIQQLKKSGKSVYIYANPQLGIEEPKTYRDNFGINLAKSGADGMFNYTYQQVWNDFESVKYRSHTMAYPTVNKPIPTLQWEGVRAAIIDVKAYFSNK